MFIFELETFPSFFGDQLFESKFSALSLGNTTAAFPDPLGNVRPWPEDIPPLNATADVHRISTRFQSGIALGRCELLVLSKNLVDQECSLR